MRHRPGIREEISEGLSGTFDRFEHGLTPHPDTRDRTTDGSHLPADYIDYGIHRLMESLREFTDLIQDTSHTVDEYQPTPISTTAPPIVAQTTADYDVDVIIEYVIVTGPAAATFIVKLGSRVWSLVMPASQILTIGPVKLNVGRNSDRLVMSSTAGVWTLELTGYADYRRITR